MHRSKNPLNLFLSCLAALAIAGGCAKPADDASNGQAAEETPAEESATTVEATVEMETEQPSSDEAAASDDAGQAPPSSEVELGDPSLTAGIPGDGPLTVEDIQNWLDDPANHEELDISLPLGLDKGEDQIKGVDANPMTRAKIELGRQLYFDRRLSIDNTISCADCHHPDEGWTRHTQFGVGVEDQTGNRNSPVAYNRILSDRQFWDGRAISLEDQAIGPIANPIEMGFTHDACVERLGNIEGYRIQFDKIFGELNIETVAKAIATFERAIVTGPSPFDYYEQFKPFETYTDEDLAEIQQDDPELFAAYETAKKGVDEHPMSESAKRGQALFFGQKAGCTACHVGPNLTDEKYWHIGVGLDSETPDMGRALDGEHKPKTGFDGFKTPTIRNVAQSAPYMHDGSQKTLMEVVEHYNKGGITNPDNTEPIEQHVPTDKIKPLNLTDEEKADLVAFMEACTGSFPPVERERLPQ